MQKVNVITGEINSVQPGGLYVALPVPAYQVLARMKEHQAQRVFVCIVSHLGLNGRESFPSYSTIAKEAGVGRNTIKKSLDILVEYGFIKIARFRQGVKDRNKYYIQDAAYNSGLMNKFAKQYRDVTAGCRRCGSGMDRGGYGIGANGPIHYGCGGTVKVWKKNEPAPQLSRISYIK